MKNCPECGLKNYDEEEFCECGFDFNVEKVEEPTCEAPSDDVLKRRWTIYLIIAFLCSTIWIKYNYVPVIPIGAAICLLVTLLSKQFKMALIVVIACAIGFIGTGASMSIYNTDQFKGIYFNIDAGANNLFYLMDKNKAN